MPIIEIALICTLVVKNQCEALLLLIAPLRCLTIKKITVDSTIKFIDVPHIDSDHLAECAPARLLGGPTSTYSCATAKTCVVA